MFHGGPEDEMLIPALFIPPNPARAPRRARRFSVGRGSADAPTSRLHATNRKDRRNEGKADG